MIKNVMAMFKVLEVPNRQSGLTDYLFVTEKSRFTMKKKTQYIRRKEIPNDWVAPNYNIKINFHDHFAVYYTEEGLASLVKKKQLKIDRFSDHQLLQQPPPRCEIFHYWDNNSREAFLTSGFRGVWICPMGITTCPPGSDVYLLWLPKPISVYLRPTSWNALSRKKMPFKVKNTSYYFCVSFYDLGCLCDDVKVMS